MEFIPHDYQKYTTDWILSHDKTMVVLEMGLGKTASTLKALDYFMFDKMSINKALVIAPKRVADFTWEDEVKKWDFAKDFKLSKILGTPKQRINGLNAEADIYCINRENVKWLIEEQVRLKNWPFDCIIVDESSNFKSSSSLRFRALRKVTKIAKNVILLTGTPIPNGYIDLWSQIYLIDNGERLEPTITKYRNTYFNPGRTNGHVVYNYKLKENAEAEINSKISDICMSLKAEDHLKMPERIDNFVELQMTPEVKKLYKELEKEYILTLDENTITAASAAVVSNKLLQMANGAVYDEDKNTVHIHDIKLEALEEIIEDNEGKPILVFYNFKSDFDRLMIRFAKLHPRTLNDSKDKDDWDNKRISLLIAHPASIGHGLNLQAGGNIIVWFGLTFSLELYQQANARLYRQGQKEAVIINHLVVKGTEDEEALKRLQSKGATQSDLIEAIKARIKKVKSESQN